MSDHPRDVPTFTGDEMYESVRVEGERILGGVCAALGLDPNLGDDEAGDAVSWIVAAVRAKYESDSSQESLADALGAADRALNFAREEIPHDWATRVAAFPAVRAVLRGVRAAPREPSEAAIVAALKACPSRPSPMGLLEVSALTVGEMTVALRAAYAVDGVGEPK